MVRKMDNNSRREFMKRMLGISVLTVSCPHILKGKIYPQKIEKKGDKLLGMYYVSFNDYPELKEVWGSVRIQIPQEYLDGFFAEIIVTHLPFDEFGKHFSCVYSLCPHEGYPVYDLDKQFHEFECSGHGTLFKADGTYLDGPAAQDLYTYEVLWDGSENGVQLNIPAVVVGVDNPDSNLYYLSDNHPNPCDIATSFDYGLENPAQLKIAIYSASGWKIATVVDGYKAAGHYKADIDASSLPPGVYFCRMELDSKEVLSKKFVVKR